MPQSMRKLMEVPKEILTYINNHTVIRSRNVGRIFGIGGHMASRYLQYLVQEGVLVEDRRTQNILYINPKTTEGKRRLNL